MEESGLPVPSFGPRVLESIVLWIPPDSRVCKGNVGLETPAFNAVPPSHVVLQSALFPGFFRAPGSAFKSRLTRIPVSSAVPDFAGY